MDIKFVKTAEEARRLLAEGYEPVECSFGGESVVGELRMDHHEEWSHLESVAVRAYRDHFGARRDDPRFVVTGAPDADACFAIAALAGILPHPSQDKPWLKGDLSSLANLVGKVDTDPIGFDLAEDPDGPTLLLWNGLSNMPHSQEGFVFGIQLWVQITTARIQGALKGVREDEAARREEAFRAKTCFFAPGDGPLVRVVESDVWGFDVWYERDHAASPDTPEGWHNPVVVAYVARDKRITIGCPNRRVAEALFGPGGLKNVFPMLGEGWGGREEVGGSPRNKAMVPDDALRVGSIIAKGQTDDCPF